MRALIVCDLCEINEDTACGLSPKFSGLLDAVFVIEHDLMQCQFLSGCQENYRPTNLFRQMFILRVQIVGTGGGETLL